MIKLDKPVYEKLWTGDIDRIVSYDEKEGFSVISLTTGEQRFHYTSLDCRNISFKFNDFSKIDDACILYVIRLGIKNLSRVPDIFEGVLYNTADYLHELIIKLKKVDSGELDVVTCTSTEKGYKKFIITQDQIGHELETLACKCLITGEGRCNWNNIHEVIKNGFDVHAGEKDSFGWLTGCIETKKGTLVYG
jgi:hypothetical protein